MKILTNFQISISVPLGYCRGWQCVAAALWWASPLGVGVGSVLPRAYCFAASAGCAVSFLWLWHCCFANVFHGLCSSCSWPPVAQGTGMRKNVNLRKMSDNKTLSHCFQVILYIVRIFLLVAHVNFTYSKVLVFRSISVYLKISWWRQNVFCILSCCLN